MAKEKRKVNEQNDDVPEPEVLKKKKKKGEEEEQTEGYSGDIQPMWVKKKPDITIECKSGKRLHIYESGTVLITQQDWSNDEGLHPGRTIKMNMDDLAEMLNGVLVQVYDRKDIKLS